MPIIKFVNESEKIEYPTEQDVCSLLCYAFAPQKTIMNDNQFVGCKPFGFPFWYMRNPLAVHQFMEFNHKRQFKHWKDLAKHRVISFSKEENPLVATLKIIAERIVSFYANNGYIAAYAIHFGTENPHIHVIVDTIRFLYKGIIINHNKKPSQPTLKRRFFQEKGGVFSWPGFGKEWC